MKYVMTVGEILKNICGSIILCQPINGVHLSQSVLNMGNLCKEYLLVVCTLRA